MEKMSTVNLVGATIPVKHEITTTDVTSSGFDITDKINKSTKVNVNTYQARLGRRLDKISKKIIDNCIRLTSSPTNMIRIKKDIDERSHDVISRTVTASDVISVIFPTIKDIPLRSLDSDGNLSPVPSMYTMNEQTYFEIYTPFYEGLDMDDVLVRIIFDEENDRNYVMALQVREILGTIGSSSLRWKKYWVTLADTDLPSKIVEIIKQATKQRETLGW